MLCQSKPFRIMLVLLFSFLSSCTASNLPTAFPTLTTVPTLDPSNCAAIGQTRVSPVDGMPQVCVPAGEFWMGALENDQQAESDEKPRHLVSLEAFWIDRTEVTNEMFAKCVAAGACHERTSSPYLWGVRLPNGTPYYGEVTYRDDPVIMLDSDEALAYCRWVGRRLPTEAEWETAARGTDERLYPWGANLDCKHAIYLGCEKEQAPASVTSYTLGSSPYGALNMSGNLWEWTADWYEANSYSQASIQNPTGSASGEFRTLRGGGWHSNPAQLRVTNRSTGKPEHSTDGEIGFRCASSVNIP